MEEKKYPRKPDSAYLQIPVFFDGDVPKEIIIHPDDIINGQPIYGDSSKRIGLGYAMKYAEEKNFNFRSVEVEIQIKNETPINNRVDRNMIETMEVDFLILDKTKRDLSDEIYEEIARQAKKTYPQAQYKNGQEWLEKHPKTGRVIFDLFPNISTAIILSKPDYSSKLLSFALLRSPAQIIGSKVMYNSNIPVNIQNAGIITNLTPT